MTTFNNQDLQSKFDHNGYIAINPLFSIDKIEEIKIELKKHNAVTCWLALEKVDEENGCIHYVKGSHKSEYRPHGRSNVLGFSQGITDFGNDEDKKNTVSFPGEPGTFLIHNAKTIHWAEGNKSQTRTRKALGFIYYGESAEINQEAHDAYQEKLRKEMKEKNLI